MNAFLNHAIKKLTTHLSGIQAIVLRGSHLNQNLVDFWSDIDMLVVLNQEIKINEEQFVKAVSEIGHLVGCEKHNKSELILLRAAVSFENSIQLIDVSVCTYKEWVLVESAADTSTVVYGNVEVQDIQFIGMHLLLDLVREFLVVEMIERDIRHQTNIHRLGSGESLPKNIKLNSLDEEDKKEVFRYIARLAEAYDTKLQLNVEGYKSNYNRVANYIEESLRQLKDTRN